MRKRRRSFTVPKKQVKAKDKDAKSEVEVVKFDQQDTQAVEEKVDKKQSHPNPINPNSQTKTNSTKDESAELNSKTSTSSKPSLVTPHQEEEQKLYAAEAQIDEIDRLIKTASEQLDEIAESEAEIATSQEEPESYDGISSTDEHIQMLEEELKNSHRQAARLAHEIDLLKAEFESEKKDLETNIKKLRKELHRTAPIQDNKFFSLSQDLREAVESLEAITHETTNVQVDLSQVDQEADDTKQLDPPLKMVKKTPDTNVDATVKETVQEPSQPVKQSDAPQPKQEVDSADQKETQSPESQKSSPKTKKKSPKKKKMMITSAAAVVVLLILSGIISSQLLGEAPVDEALVQEYLSAESGEVAGAQVDSASQTTTNQSNPTPDKVITQQGEKQQDASQSNVSFAESIWDTFSDNNLGVRIQYPINAVKLTKTESNATFQRKNGYIFKVQRIETGLDLEEYWKQIETTSLEYQANPTTLDDKEALLLELQEEADFPGNKYLVKTDSAIIEVWYATPSPKFDDQDMLRVDRMLETLSFTEN